MIPVAIYIGALYALYAFLHPPHGPVPPVAYRGDGSRARRLRSSLRRSGSSIATCLIVVMFAPLVTVIGYETLGHRHLDDAFERMRDEVGQR